ncbi:TetR/AcrR family transcriptional regulator [Rothia aerolata]|uniref:HTH tetR-type domain-containing protein n=1 Tax=Rothia aerolata TaxID=1812262 RepID=A0A917IMX8_9MICC|nr:TetR family transcriptional regulator C-terminal domain-containing protein [Rothia aerolata]GGH57297.1 hypothetical protein GCM10007359_02280 [Rothia aerolata]
MSPSKHATDRSTAITGNAAVIADSAIRVMVEQGLDALSVRHVAAAAQVAPGTVQYHMGTRDDILAKAFIRSVQRQEERTQRPSDSTDVLELMCIRLAELLPTGPVQREDAAMWVIVGAAASTRDWLADMYDSEIALFRARVGDALVAAQRLDQLRSGITPQQGARLVTALINGLTLDYLNASGDVTEQLLADLRAGLGLIVKG